MQLPIHSLNSKHEHNLVRISQEQLHFDLVDTRGIEITTGNQTVAGFLGIKVTKLGYVLDDDDMCNEEEVEMDVMNVPEAIANEASVDMIDTRSALTKANEK